MTSYNTGQFAHTVQVRFYLNVVQDTAPAAPAQPLSIVALSPLPDASPASSLDVLTPQALDEVTG